MFVSGFVVKHSNPLRLNGIDLGSFYLPRTNLVARLVTSVSQNQFCLISSPAGTGKTSLLTLLSAARNDAEVVGIKCDRGTEWCQKLGVYGIDVLNKKISIPEDGTDLLFLLDDAQLTYTMVEQWSWLIKGSPCSHLPNDLTLRAHLPGRVRIVISVTHALHKEGESPESFKEIPSKFKREDLLLSDNEAESLLKSPIGLPDYASEYKNLISVITQECSGHAAAIVISGSAMEELLHGTDVKDEKTCLKAFFSESMRERMGRCFGNTFSKPKGRCLELLEYCLLSPGGIAVSDLPMEVEKDFDVLKKCGILTESDEKFKFSSKMAKLFFQKSLFPHRAEKNPKTLKHLIIGAVSKLSASVLQQSTTNDSDFPKEAAFQHLFMQGLCACTRLDCLVCPELSRVPEKATKIEGEIDFYINSELRWGIELLVNGDRLMQHIKRGETGGKYFPLEMKEYVVVDFRFDCGGALKRHKRRISVVFAPYFKSCKVQIGLHDEVLINLKP